MSPDGFPVQALPRLSAASAPLTESVDAVDEHGRIDHISIPVERPLTVFVDKRELVTLMTLGARPEWLVLGYLLNQRLVDGARDVESITVDWEVGAAAVRTREGISDFESRTAQRVVTTGCGQGTVFGGLMDSLDSVVLPPPSEGRISQQALYALLEAVRRQETTYKSAGSVHGCALFCVSGDDARLALFVEDVGRHNAIDTLAGWMAMHPEQGCDSGRVFYTTGRLTSEMVIKSAQMGVPIVVSRSGITQMGHAIASRLGLTLFGRASNRRFLCYCGLDRFDGDPALAGPRPVPPGGEAPR